MKPTLSRRLLGYRWELRGKKVAIIDVNNNIEVVLDKVRLMSLMKFLPNCLDKMRIEEGKAFRAKLKLIRQKAHDKAEIVKTRFKKLKIKNQQNLFAKARKVKQYE